MPNIAFRRWTITGLLSLAMILAYVDRSNFSVALSADDFKALFRFGDTDRGLLNSAFFWSYCLMQVPAGWLVDRCGVKYPLAVAFLIWSLVSAATALTGTFGQLIAVRVVLGIGESVVSPAGMRWIRLHFPEHRRGLTLGLFQAGARVGSAVGAWAAAILISRSGWKMMFVILGLSSLVWLVPWLALAANDDRELERAEREQVPAMPFGRIMASPVIWGTIIGAFCYMYFVYFCITWMPAYLHEQRHLSLDSMGTYMLFSFFGMAVVAALGGWAADAIIARGANPVIVRRTFIIAGFLIASSELVGARSSSVPVALFFAIFSLSGLGLTTGNFWALTHTLIPGGAIGRTIGIQNGAAQIPGIVAPILTGWLIQRTGSYTAPMQAIVLVQAVGIAAYLFLVREKFAPRIRA